MTAIAVLLLVAAAGARIGLRVLRRPHRPRALELASAAPMALQGPRWVRTCTRCHGSVEACGPSCRGLPYKLEPGRPVRMPVPGPGMRCSR